MNRKSCEKNFLSLYTIKILKLLLECFFELNKQAMLIKVQIFDSIFI